MSNYVSLKPQTSKLLLDEAPLVVLPSLATAIGLEAAVVLQQLHFLIRIKLERHREHPKESERDIHAGRIWVWNTYQKWQENYFSFLSIRSLQRIFLNLEKRKLIIAGNYNEHNLNKTKWYSINYEHPLINAINSIGTKTSHRKNENNSLAENSDQPETVVDGANLAHSTCQNGAFDDASLAPSYTKTSNTKNYRTKTTTTKEESSSTDFPKKEPDKVIILTTFPVPTTAEEADEIIKDFLKITYPNGEGIKNKCSLSHFMKKKLLNGQLEIPEGWHDFQIKKKDMANHNQESQIIADAATFRKAKEEFAKLPVNEQKKYLDAARRTANGIELQDSTALCVAIQFYSEGMIPSSSETRPP